MAKRRVLGKQQDISRRPAKGAAQSPPHTRTSDTTGSAVTGEAGTGDPLAHMTRLAGNFNAAADQCIKDADVDAVHEVRTGSRRVQALVEAIQRETRGPGNALARPAGAWLRQLKQVRRAAGPVRDLDVHRKLLEKWSENLLPNLVWEEPSKQVATQEIVSGNVSNRLGDDGADGDDARPDQPRPAKQEEEAQAAKTLRRQAATLDDWLKERRRQAAEILQKQVRKRRPRLAERQVAFFAAAEHARGQRSRAPRPASLMALEEFVRVADSMPLLDASNLHDFRKAIKKARYVAESGGEQPNAKSVAKALKQVQDVIGDWHDWLCLTEEAKNALGEAGRELTAGFEAEREQHLAQAIGMTDVMRGRLSGEWMAAGSSRRGSRSRAPANKDPDGAPPKLPSRFAENSGVKGHSASPDEGVA